MKKIVIIVISILIVLVLAVLIFFNVTFMSKKEIKQIVLEHANLKESDINRWEAELNYEDGNLEYDVEFVYNNQEYNYEVNAKTGEIIIYEID